MKNLFLLLLIFISSFSYSQKLKTFVHPTDGFEIGIPKGWDITNNSKCSLLVHSSKDSIGGTIIIHIQPFVDATFDVIYEDYVRTLEVNKTVHEIGEEDIHEREYKVYYKTYSTSGVNLKALEYFTIKGNEIFIASFTAQESNFNKLEPLFKKIAATIKY